jgi:hypothetical protein
MPRNASGTFQKPAGTTAVTGQTIQASPYNTLQDDVATALTGSLPVDGSKPMGAALPMGGFKVTGMADGAASTDAITKSQLDAIASGNVPAGTIMLFVQTAAPTGWTKSTTHNDKALRVVSGAASTGGSTAFTSVFAARTITAANVPAHTHSFSATTSGQSVTHTHTYTGFNESQAISPGGNSAKGGSETNGTSGNASVDHTHTVSGTSGSYGSGTSMDFSVQYVDVIIAVKD